MTPFFGQKILTIVMKVEFLYCTLDSFTMNIKLIRGVQTIHPQKNKNMELWHAWTANIPYKSFVSLKEVGDTSFRELKGYIIQGVEMSNWMISENLTYLVLSFESWAEQKIWKWKCQNECTGCFNIKTNQHVCLKSPVASLASGIDCFNDKWIQQVYLGWTIVRHHQDTAESMQEQVNDKT
jgi:hypothetical protein